MNIRHALIAVTISTAGLTSAAVAAMPPAATWEIGPFIRGRNYSVGMPVQPTAVRGGWYFDFPATNGGSVHYVTYPSGSLAGARQITIRYRIDAAPGTRFVPVQSPGEAPRLTLYFQQRGDNWSGSRRYSTYRWYSIDGGAITPGLHTFSMRFDQPWTPVNGGTNADQPQGFRAALADTDRVGLAFGSWSGRGHGLAATAPARFTLLAFDIK